MLPGLEDTELACRIERGMGAGGSWAEMWVIARRDRKAGVYPRRRAMAGCPSGQWERTVNPSALPSKVRILHPPRRRERPGQGYFPRTWASAGWTRLVLRLMNRMTAVVLVSAGVAVGTVIDLYFPPRRSRRPLQWTGIVRRRASTPNPLSLTLAGPTRTSRHCHHPDQFGECLSERGLDLDAGVLVAAGWTLVNDRHRDSQIRGFADESAP